MNQGIELLQPYPFEKLAQLLEHPVSAGDGAINLSIGEPRHRTPEFIIRALQSSLGTAASYPLTRGSKALRQAIADWLVRRFSLPQDCVDAERNVLPVNGTREALFAICQSLIDTGRDAPLVLTANPFYQIYEGAALLAGARPWYINCDPGRGFKPDYDSVPDEIWNRCQLLYLCSPNNPTGAVCEMGTYEKLIDLAERFDFVIAADECYSEIYLDENDPPLGLLEAATKAGNPEFRRCLVFHSLSKRSNVPGMRSGFAAGDAGLIDIFYRYRTYHGSAMAPYTQEASIAAWQDEDHVRENRRQYREKFSRVMEVLQPVLNVSAPRATFYLWPETPVDDTEYVRGLYQQQHVTVLPGSFLSREINGVNPGANRVRIALVAGLEECLDAAERIVAFTETL